MQHPDHMYIDGLLNNNRIVIEEIYRRFAPVIERMVLKNQGNKEDAADLFQDGLMAIIKMGRSKENFELTCPFEALIYKICRNKWINELEKRGRNGVTFTDTERYTYSEDTIRIIDEIVCLEEKKKLFREKTAELSKSCQELLGLCWEKRSMKEVAEILNIAHGFARKKKCQCIAKLMALIQASPTFEYLKRECYE